MNGDPVFRAFCAGALLAVSWSAPVAAHDLQGLLTPLTLPENVRKQIEEREKVRHPDNRALFDPRLPSEERAAMVRALGVSPRFESIEAVFGVRALWPQRGRLAICFMDGRSAAHDEVMKVAREVVGHTNLQLDPRPRKCTDKTVKIRVTFRRPGYWSYIGTDALLIPRSQPTLGLQNLDLKLPWSESTIGIVRHELMHALGALHEHQHPDARCEDELDWKVAAAALRWSEAEMQTNFRQLLFSSEIKASGYDKLSNMHYQLPAYFWRSGEKSACYLAASNDALSTADIAMLKTLYPKE